MRSSRILAMIGCAAVLADPATAQPALLRFPDGAATLPSPLPGLAEARPASLAVPLTAFVPGARFRYDLGGGREQIVIVRSRGEVRPGTDLIEGVFEGQPRSRILLTQRDGLWSGLFEAQPGEQEVLLPTPGGSILASIPAGHRFSCACGQASSPIPLPPAAWPRESKRSATAAPAPVLDVLLVYTPAARAAAGGVPAIESLADLGIARANHAFMRSAVALRLRLVGLEEFDFAESGSIYGDINRLRSDARLGARRDALQADVVATLAKVAATAEVSGVADVLTRFSFRFGETQGYSVNEFSAIALTDLLVHEIGHNLGCHHEVERSVGEVLVRPDAHGWGFTTPDAFDYCTVMASSGEQIGAFSNPALYFREIPIGSLGRANNAATINETAAFTTRFRPRQAPAELELQIPAPVASFAEGKSAEIVLRRTGGVMELPMEAYLNFSNPLDEEFQIAGLVSAGTGVWRAVLPAGATELRLAVVPRGRNGFVPLPPPSTRVVLLADSYSDYVVAGSKVAEFTVVDRGPYLPPPEVVPRATLINVSTRLEVGLGLEVGIAGFVVEGPGTKRCIVRAIGPSLRDFGIPNPLANPVLELRDASGALLAENDDWGADAGADSVRQAGLGPPDAAEAAVARTLAPGAYTAVLRGVAGGTGVALVEVYDVAPADPARPINVSTRGKVGADASVLIGGFVVDGNATRRVIVRALGPSLRDFGVTTALPDPVLELRDALGNLVAQNDNWRDRQAAEIQATGFAPRQNTEAAIVRALAPGSYTAVVRARPGTALGVGLVEVYEIL